ncbi:MAG: hypothetical protein RLZZ336_1415 [Cyanobacteriota bacterium]
MTPPPSTPLQATLRLVLTVGVVQGLTHVTGLADGYYASLAVLSVSVGSYGDTLELGRQRLLGTALGAVIVLIAYPAFQGLPLVVGLPLAMLLAQLLAAGLRLKVGYTVCLFVVVVGWLAHDSQLDSWLPLRLIWTALGVCMALLSIRLFWPSRARLVQRQGLLDLLDRLGVVLRDHLDRATPRRGSDPLLRELRDQLLSLRSQRGAALRELGSGASDHPVAQMWAAFDAHCETLILVLDGFQRLGKLGWQQPALRGLAVRLSERVLAMQQQMARWREQLLRNPQGLPDPPLPLWVPQNLTTWVDEPSQQTLATAELQQLATRLNLLNQLERSLHETELRWQQALTRA